MSDPRPPQPPRAPGAIEPPPAQYPPPQFPRTQFPQSPPVAPSEPPPPSAPASPGWGQQPPGPPNLPPAWGYQQPAWGRPGPVTPPPAPRRRKGRGLWVGLGILGVVALLASAVGVVAGRSTDSPSAITSASIGRVPVDQNTRELPDNAARIEVQGSGDPDVMTTVRAALADIDDYWSATWSDVGSGAYRTIRGGFVAAVGSQAVRCDGQAVEVAGNAFYCPTDDRMAFDTGTLLPQIQEAYGPLAVAVVLAHEWGHAIEARTGLVGPTVLWEQQADCYAGSWVADVTERGDSYFTVDDDTLDLALTAMVGFKDPLGTDPSSPAAHGTAFDRIRAFQDGIQNGPTTCVQYTTKSLEKTLVATPFLSPADYQNQGNLPLQDAYDLMNTDLADFWTKRWSTFGDGQFEVPELKVYGTGLRQDPAGGQVTPDAEKPSCDDPIDIADGMSYCPDSNVVAIQSDGAAVSAHEQIGDNALGELLGTAYALAALEQLDGSLSAGPELTRRADCLTGVWTRSVFDGDRVEDGTEGLRLSPGDLDEAVMVLLTTADHAKDSRTGTGFDRVAAYRSGFTDGPSACDA